MNEIRFPAVEKLQGAPKIQKSGIISACGGECSVFVRNGRLLRLENEWDGFGGLEGPCAVIRDYFTDEVLSVFGGDGTMFYSAYCEEESIYAYATRDNVVYCYKTNNLSDWERSIAVVFPESFRLFNTAVCRGEGIYMMAVEAAAADNKDGGKYENSYVGTCFTEFFVKSDDLLSWSILPFGTAYTKERYNACPALKYSDGFYYMICLEELPCYRFAPYVYRTKDFDTWEIGFYNPLFTAGNEDLYPKTGVTLPADVLQMQFQHINSNNSDVDLCEYEGKTYIVYASGNQGITWGGCTCEAVYDGGLDEFLKRCFS